MAQRSMEVYAKDHLKMSENIHVDWADNTSRERYFTELNPKNVNRKII